MNRSSRAIAALSQTPDDELHSLLDDESLILIDILLVFFAIASVIGGTMILAVLWKDSRLTDYWFVAVLAVCILSAGLTVIWVKSRFHRG